MEGKLKNGEGRGKKAKCSQLVLWKQSVYINPELFSP